MKKQLQQFALWLLPVLLLFLSCQKELACYTCNTPPNANAGIDQKITLPTDSIFLDGRASADNDGTIEAWLWKLIDGPATVIIRNKTTAITTLKNLVVGVYQFELQVTDNMGAFSKDTVRIVLDDPVVNQQPVANAGPDKMLTFPANTATLNGTNSTDPDNNIATYKWSNLSGLQATIAQPNSVVAQVSGLQQGTYLFQLKVTDAAGLFSTDTVKIIVGAPQAIICGEANRPMIAATLTPFARLSEPCMGMAVASAGNKIVFTGASLSGNPPNYGSSLVHIFDVVTQVWTTATLSASRADVAAVALGNKIFFAGGRLGNGGSYSYFSTVDIFDVVTNSWTVANLSQSRAYVAAAAIGNKVFFAGGEQEWPRPVSDRIDVYDMSTDQWSTATLSEQRNGLAAVAANNKIYFAGGGNQLGGVNNVSGIIDVYDNATNSWSVSALSEPKAFFAGIATGNKIYWAGGDEGGGKPTCKVEIKDLATQTSTGASLFHPFSYVTHEGMNAVIKDNKIIWFATLDPLNGNATDRFNIYDISTNTWAIGVLPFKINGASIIAVNNIIYVAGGYVNGKMSDQVWRLTF